MRKATQWLMVGVLTVAVPALAAAQTPQPDPDPVRPAPPAFDDPLMGPLENQWYVTGFLGSDFGQQAEGGNFAFGAGLGYMWNSSIGGEFLAGFTPNFHVRDDLLLPGEEPQVNTYMFNAIAAVPVGVERQWQPFISGGLGAITLRSDLLDPDPRDDIIEPFRADASRFGGNIGVGLMGFSGPWGVRADVRYFRAFTDADINDLPANLGDAVLSGLDFWRANIGVAFRW